MARGKVGDHPPFEKSIFAACNSPLSSKPTLEFSEERLPLAGDHHIWSRLNGCGFCDRSGGSERGEGGQNGALGFFSTKAAAHAGHSTPHYASARRAHERRCAELRRMLRGRTDKERAVFAGFTQALAFLSKMVLASKKLRLQRWGALRSAAVTSPRRKAGSV